MSAAVRPKLEPGKVYRTRDLARCGANPTRLAARLVREGALAKLGHGLYHHPRQSLFGPTPPTPDAVLTAFLGGDAWIVSGPPAWNPLGLGSTAMFADTLVYNTKRSGTFTFGGRRHRLRRVAFPAPPTPEWYAVDLLRHHAQVGVDTATILERLGRAVHAGRFEPAALVAMAERCAEAWVVRAVVEAIGRAG